MNCPRIKVCGLTREKDIELISRFAIDAAGLIFHPKSPRKVTVSKGKQLRRLIPPTALVFAVVQADTVEKLLKLAGIIRADVLQIHGKLSQRDVTRLQREGYRVTMVYNPVADSTWKSTNADFVLFDNSAKSSQGGTGVPFDWSAVGRPYPGNLILAGGLRESNIESAIQKFRPMLVDLNSGVESAPGVKSASKLSRMVRLVRK